MWPPFFLGQECIEVQDGEMRRIKTQLAPHKVVDLNLSYSRYHIHKLFATAKFCKSLLNGGGLHGNKILHIWLLCSTIFHSNGLNFFVRLIESRQ